MLMHDLIESSFRFVTLSSRLEDQAEDVGRVAHDLRVMKSQLERMVGLSTRFQARQAFEEVQLWYSKADKAAVTSSELLRKAVAIMDSLVLGGVCSMAWFSTIRLVQQLDECLSLLESLVLDGERLVFLQAVVDGLPELEWRLRHARPDEGDGFGTLLDQVLHELEQERVHMIGVWGDASSGKTTLLKQISQKFVGSKGFSAIRIDVRGGVNLEMIQEEMGDKMGLPTELKSIAEKAEYISTELKTKKILLLLDNVGLGPIDLNQIGVPPLESLTLSKIVFTTRLEKVCREMKPQPQKSLPVQPLTEAEAWKLFVKQVGGQAMYKNPAIFPFAKTLVQKCRGQPLALTIVGLSMLGKMHPEEWAEATKAFDDNWSDQLLTMFKSTYDNLPQTVKSCFLYCALYPEGLPILKSELLELWTSQKDFWIDGDIVDETEDRLSNAGRVLRSLFQARLLDDHGEWVTMPKIIRSMALRIAKRDALVLAGENLEEEPDVARWVGKKMVSLMHNDIWELIQVPTCPTLFTLLLNKNQEFLKLSDSFFESMGMLTVLNLSSTGIKELPRSLSSLVSLEHLDISYTKVKKLPIVLKKLGNLKHFDVNGLDLSLSSLDRLICYLESLQVLKMMCDYHYDQEEAREITMLDDETLMEELLHLERLTLLQITISSFSSLQKLIATTQLSRRTQTLYFRRCRAPLVDVSLLESMENLESLFVTQCYFRELHASSMRCFSSITRVAVSDCIYLKHLTCLALMPNLRILEVSNCLGLKEILNEDILQGIMAQNTYLNPLSNLAVLELFNLSTLVKICSTSLELLFLYELRVSECPQLKKLPLNLNSRNGCSIQLTADSHWFDKIEWEDDETRYAVWSRFKFFKVISHYARNYGPKPPKMDWPRQR